MQLALQPWLVVSEEDVAECLSSDAIARQLVSHAVLFDLGALDQSPLVGQEAHVLSLFETASAVRTLTLAQLLLLHLLDLREQLINVDGVTLTFHALYTRVDVPDLEEVTASDAQTF